MHLKAAHFKAFVSTQLYHFKSSKKNSLHEDVTPRALAPSRPRAKTLFKLEQLKHYCLMCLCLWALPIWGQNDFFYHQGKKVLVESIPGQSILEFPTGLDNANNLVPSNFYQDEVSEGVYIVANSAIGFLQNYVGDYSLRPSYRFRSDTQRLVLYTQRILLQLDLNQDTTGAYSYLVDSLGLIFKSDYGFMSVYTVPSTADALHVARMVGEKKFAKFCHPDFIVPVKAHSHIPNDPFFAQQWYLHNTGQGTNDGLPTLSNADIDAPEAWAITKGDSNIIVAVLDNGVAYNHPDLDNSRNLRLFGTNLMGGLDGLASNDPSPTSNSIYNEFHGTACAGIIAANQDNNVGITGIAPNCKILPIKLYGRTSTGQQSFPLSRAVSALSVLPSYNVNIVSCSWGFELGDVSKDSMLLSMMRTWMQPAVQNAINNGITVIFSAGNDYAMMGYPARMKDELHDMVVVGASDRLNRKAFYSPFEQPNIDLRPNPQYVDLVAPSNYGMPDMSFYTTGETYNVWTLDLPGLNFGANAWRDSNSFLWPGTVPVFGETLPANNDAYTGRFGGTSASAPQVAGVAALMMSVNPCLANAPGMVKNLLLMSADTIRALPDEVSPNLGYYYYRDPVKAPRRSREVGYGKLNAHKAVLAAQAMQSSTLDLYIRDVVDDLGLTGPNGTGANSDQSPDIWVRASNDGHVNQFHEYPIFYSANNQVYAYVRVWNKSCVPSTGTEELALYWSMASSWNSWPQNWDGTKPDTGNLIGRQTIPVLQPGEYAILEFPHNVVQHPRGTTDYCLLARIENSLVDTITVYPLDPSIPSWGLSQDISQNNNIAQRNVEGLESIQRRRGAFLVGNVIPNAAESFDIRIRVPRHEQAWTPDITKEAELVFTFDSAAWSIFDAANAFNQEGVEVLTPGKIRLTLPDVTFSNLNFAAGQREAIEITYSFLAEELTDNTDYLVEITQMPSNDPTVILGTQTYYIIKAPRDPIWANAGGDKTMAKNSSIELQAQDVGEAATYNWYDQSGNLLHTGRNFTVSPNSTESYKLEVIADLDGLKDYDEVEVRVNPYAILSLTPNPASNQVLVEYDAETAQTAYLMLSQPLSGQYHNYLLDPQHSQISLQISHLPSGIYTLILVCNGEAVATRSLQISH